MRKNSIKNTRINGEVQKALSEILRSGLKDPRVHPMTSVTQVEVAPDLKTARVFVSVLGSEEERRETLKGLRSAEGYIRRELARIVNLRNTPELRFQEDTSIEYAVSMSRLIDEVRGADEESRQARGEEYGDEYGDGEHGDGESDGEYDDEDGGDDE